MKKLVLNILYIFIFLSCTHKSKTDSKESLLLLNQEIEIMNEINYKFYSFLQDNHPILSKIETISKYTSQIPDLSEDSSDSFNKIIDSLVVKLLSLNEKSNTQYLIQLKNKPISKNLKFMAFNHINFILWDYYFDLSMYSYSFDKFIPAINPNDFICSVGDTFELDIFLAGCSSYNSLIATDENNDTLKIENCVPVIEIVGTEIGDFSRKGKLYLKDMDFDFTINYTVE